MEAKKEALLKEASERNLIGSPNFQDGLAKLNAMKPLPYGTLHAVGIISISFLLVMLAFYRGIVGGQCFSFFSAFSMQNFYPFQYQTSLKMLLLVFSDSKVQVIMLFNYLTFNLQSLIGLLANPHGSFSLPQLKECRVSQTVTCSESRFFDIKGVQNPCTF